MQIVTKAWDYLLRRQQAYRQVFNPENVYTKEVLVDLAKFCRAEDTCFNPDPRIHAQLEGRREVWIRIARHLELDPHKLYELLK